MAEDTKFVYPRQRTKRGVAGYKNLPPGTVIVEEGKVPTGDRGRVITTGGTTRPQA
jgi:hypothetical protein